MSEGQQTKVAETQHRSAVSPAQMSGAEFNEQEQILEGSIYPESLLFSPVLTERGNAPVQSAIMQNMQRTYGNKTLQRWRSEHQRSLLQVSGEYAIQRWQAARRERNALQRLASTTRLPDQHRAGYPPSTPIQREEENRSWLRNVRKGGNAAGEVAEVLDHDKDAISILGSSKLGSFIRNSAKVDQASVAKKWLSPFSLWNGIEEMREAVSTGQPSMEGAADFTAGGLSAVSGGLETLGLVGEGLSAVGASNAGGLLAKLVGEGSLLGSVGSLAGGSALVYEAGKGGYKLGTLLNKHTRVGEHAVDGWDTADKIYTIIGQALGITKEEENQSAMQDIADWGSGGKMKELAAAALLAPGGAYASMQGLATGAHSGAKEYGDRALSGVKMAGGKALEWLFQQD